MASSVDITTVLGWNPCEDFPRERIDALFGEKRRATVWDILATDIRQDEILWAVLREAFFSQEELDTMALAFVIHVCDLANEDGVADELLNAICAMESRFDLLPEDPRQERWARGATESEKACALAALWSATARANTATEEEERLRLWNEERDYQVSVVRKKAGVQCQ